LTSRPSNVDQQRVYFLFFSEERDYYDCKLNYDILMSAAQLAGTTQQRGNLVRITIPSDKRRSEANRRRSESDPGNVTSTWPLDAQVLQSVHTSTVKYSGGDVEHVVTELQQLLFGTDCHSPWFDQTLQAATRLYEFLCNNHQSSGAPPHSLTTQSKEAVAQDLRRKALEHLGIFTAADLCGVGMADESISVADTIWQQLREYFSPIQRQKFAYLMVSFLLLNRQLREQTNKSLLTTDVSAESQMLFVALDVGNYSKAWEIFSDRNNAVRSHLDNTNSDSQSLDGNQRMRQLLLEWGVLAAGDLEALGPDHINQLLDCLRPAQRSKVARVLKASASVNFNNENRLLWELLSLLAEIDFVSKRGCVSSFQQRRQAGGGESPGLDSILQIVDSFDPADVLRDVTDIIGAGTGSQAQDLWELLHNPMKCADKTALESCLLELGICEAGDLAFANREQLQDMAKHLKIAQQKRFWDLIRAAYQVNNNEV
jgi:hypothetical protein